MRSRNSSSSHTSILLLFVFLGLWTSACTKPNEQAIQAVVDADNSVTIKTFFTYSEESDSCLDSSGKQGFNHGTIGECADLAGQTLDEILLLDKNLRGANFEYASLRNADLSGSDLTGANLLEADLTGAKLSGSIMLRAKLSPKPVVPVGGPSTDPTLTEPADPGAPTTTPEATAAASPTPTPTPEPTPAPTPIPNAAPTPIASPIADTSTDTTDTLVDIALDNALQVELAGELAVQESEIDQLKEEQRQIETVMNDRLDQTQPSRQLIQMAQRHKDLKQKIKRGLQKRHSIKKRIEEHRERVEAKKRKRNRRDS